jgi:hypothetical protein
MQVIKSQTQKSTFRLLVTAAIFLFSSFECRLLANTFQSSEDVPVWVKKSSKTEDLKFIYSVGISSSVDKIETGLEQSWTNALENFARTRFPQLQQIMQFSKETLKSSAFERISTLALDEVNWNGISESTADGSPFIKEQIDDQGRTTYSVFRLLRWEKESFRAENNRQSASTSKRAIRTEKHVSNGSGRLNVFTNPDNAVVVLNGEVIGRSNISLSGMQSGSHSLNIQKEGFEKHEQAVTISDGVTKDININLRKRTGNISLRSIPDGALALINGLPVGRTPLTISREFGELKVSFQLDGYFPKEKIFVHNENESFIEGDLDQKPGKLTVIASPVDARVFLNGDLIGKSPILSHGLRGGTQRIRVEYPGYVTQEQDVHISGAIETTVSIQLSSEQFNQTQERLGFERLQLGRLKIRYEDDPEKYVRILEKGCLLKRVDFCLSLAEHLSEKDFQEQSDELKREMNKAETQFAFINSFCMKEKLNDECIELELRVILEIVALKAFKENFKKSTVNKSKGDKEYLRRAILAFDKVLNKYSNKILDSCKANASNLKSRYICQYLSNGRLTYTTEELDNFCSAHLKGWPCLKAVDSILRNAKELGGGVPPQERLRLNEIASNSCGNIGFYELSENDSYAFRKFCENKIDEIMLKNLCEVQKNSGACKSLLFRLSKNIDAKINSDEISQIVKKACEYATDIWYYCTNTFIASVKNEPGSRIYLTINKKNDNPLEEFSKNSVNKVEIEIDSNAVNHNFNLACDFQDSASCLSAGRFEEAFHISQKKCIYRFGSYATTEPAFGYSECETAFMIHKENASKSYFALDKEFFQAGCKLGLAEVCFEGRSLDLKKISSIETNCGVATAKHSSKSIASRFDAVDFNWKYGYCSAVIEILGSKNFSEKFKKRLISAGCKTHKNLSACKLDENMSNIIPAFVEICKPNDKLKFQDCKTLAKRLPLKRNTDYCEKHSIIASCSVSGDEAYFVKNDYDSALKYFEKTCSAGRVLDCGKLSAIYEQKGNSALAIKNMEIACNEDIFLYCSRLGAIYHKLGLLDEALIAHRKACESNEEGEYCMKAAYQLVGSSEWKSFLRKGYDLLTNECKSGKNDSCRHLEEFNESFQKAKKAGIHLEF